MIIPEVVSIAAKFMSRRWGCNFLYINSDFDEEAIRCIVKETEAAKRNGYAILFVDTGYGKEACVKTIVSYLNEMYFWIGIVVLNRCDGVGSAMLTDFDEVWADEPEKLEQMYESGIFHALDGKKCWSEFKFHQEIWEERDDGMFEKDLMDITDEVRRNMADAQVTDEQPRKIAYLEKAAASKAS